MPHVPGIGGFVGQMGLASEPVGIRAQQLTVNDASTRGTMVLPPYQVGDLLVVQFVCVKGSGIVSSVTPAGVDAGWTPAPQQLAVTSGTIHVIASYWRFATDLAVPVPYWSSGWSVAAPNWGMNAIAFKGAKPATAPLFSNWYSDSNGTSHNPPNDWPVAPTGPTQYVAMGALSGGAVVNTWPAEVPDSRLNNVAGTARPHQAAFKNAVGGALDVGIYVSSASQQLAYQCVAVRGDS